MTDSAAALRRANGSSMAEVERIAAACRVDSGRELIDRMAARQMTLRFVDGPVIAKACCINGRWGA